MAYGRQPIMRTQGTGPWTQRKLERRRQKVRTTIVYVLLFTLPGCMNMRTVARPDGLSSDLSGVYRFEGAQPNSDSSTWISSPLINFYGIQKGSEITIEQEGN